MKVSNNFNRFYHAQIKEFFLKAPRKLKIEGVGTFYLGISFNNFKQLLKFFNLDYPYNERGYRLSTRDISNKELVQHIEFIFKLAAQNGVEMEVIKQEWELLIRIANEQIHMHR